MCANILKIISSQYKNESIPEEDENENDEKKDVGSEKTDTEKKDSEKKDSDSSKKGEDFTCTNPECTRSKPGVSSGNLCAHAKECLEKEKSAANGENKENKPKDKTPEIVKPTESAKPPSTCTIFSIQNMQFLNDGIKHIIL